MSAPPPLPESRPLRAHSIHSTFLHMFHPPIRSTLRPAPLHTCARFGPIRRGHRLLPPSMTAWLALALTASRSLRSSLKRRPCVLDPATNSNAASLSSSEHESALGSAIRFWCYLDTSNPTCLNQSRRRRVRQAPCPSSSCSAALLMLHSNRSPSSTLAARSTCASATDRLRSSPTLPRTY